jgi:hypothetical protein
MTERHDVHSSLAEMDRKLRELQQELAQVSQRPQPAPASLAERQGPAPPVAPAPAPPVTAFPPASVPQAATPPPYPYTAPSSFAPPASVAHPPVAPQPPAPAAPVVAGPSNAARIVQEAAARLVVMTRQIDELHRSRDELQRSVSALAAELATSTDEPPAPGPAPGYEATPFPRPAYDPPPVAAPDPAGGAPLAPVESRPEVEPGPFAPAAGPGAPSFPPSAASPGNLSGVSPPPEGAANRNQFEGQVVVNAGPFTDIATLGAFEQALGRLPRAEEVYVRGFEGNRALIDLRLAGPVRLLDEMRRSVPFPFGVVEVGHGMITINVDAPAGNSNPAVTLR